MNCEIVVKSLGIKPERVREFINQINEQQQLNPALIINQPGVQCQGNKKKSF